MAWYEKSYKKKKVSQLFWTCKSPIFSYAIFHFQPFPREPSFLEEKETARIIPYIFYRSKLSNYLIYYCCIQTLNIIDVWLDINTRFIRIIQLTNWITYIYFNNTTTYSYFQDDSIIWYCRLFRNYIIK